MMNNNFVVVDSDNLALALTNTFGLTARQTNIKSTVEEEMKEKKKQNENITI